MYTEINLYEIKSTLPKKLYIFSAVDKIESIENAEKEISRIAYQKKGIVFNMQNFEIISYLKPEKGVKYIEIDFLDTSDNIQERLASIYLQRELKILYKLESTLESKKSEKYIIKPYFRFEVSKINEKFYNVAKVLYRGKVVYEQPKVKLFKFGGETDYFSSGRMDDIEIFEIDGLKIGLLICFELRFLEIWQKLKGADIILVPAMWGKLRKRHFEQFTETLALMNQCFLVASDSANDDMAKSSAIIDPFGVPYRDDRKALLCKECDLGDIKKMRRYMDIGL